MSKVSSPAKQKSEAREQTKEIRVIVPTKASHDPDTMMILLRHTHFADTAMLTPGWLDEVTGTTKFARTVEYMVIGILPHVPFMVVGSNV